MKAPGNGFSLLPAGLPIEIPEDINQSSPA